MVFNIVFWAILLQHSSRASIMFHCLQIKHIWLSSRYIQEFYLKKVTMTLHTAIVICDRLKKKCRFSSGESVTDKWLLFTVTSALCLMNKDPHCGSKSWRIKILCHYLWFFDHTPQPIPFFNSIIRSTNYSWLLNVIMILLEMGNKWQQPPWKYVRIKKTSF